MQIKRHDRSHLVELRDGSAWRIWPGDIPKTLQWLPLGPTGNIERNAAGLVGRLLPQIADKREGDVRSNSEDAWGESMRFVTVPVG